METETIESAVWDRVNNGFISEECGSSSDMGTWRGILRSKRYTYILSEDSNGFKGVDIYSDKEEAEREWQKILDAQEEIDGPQDGDITIEGKDDSAYQYGKRIGRREDIKAWMEKSKFWPNVWIVSDHGNAHLVTDL